MEESRDVVETKARYVEDDEKYADAPKLCAVPATSLMKALSCSAFSEPGAAVAGCSDSGGNGWAVDAARLAHLVECRNLRKVMVREEDAMRGEPEPGASASDKK